MDPYYTNDAGILYQGDVMACLSSIQDQSIQCCATSPPYYGLRDYGVDGQIGLEDTPEAFVERMVEVFREVRRVLRDDGTLWLNLGDSYANTPVGKFNGGGTVLNNRALDGHSSSGTMDKLKASGLKQKDLMMMPARVALALQADGWWLRSDIAWCKKSAMPESVTDRPTSAWEHIFLLSKSARYYYDAEAVKVPYETANPNSPSFRANGKSDSRKKHTLYCPACDGSGDGPDGEDGDECLECMGTGLPSGGYKTVPKNEGMWHPAGGGANLRNYWLLGPEPFPDAHFATFPTEIPRRAIKAGTSERGACSSCGAPWERVVERTTSIPMQARGYTEDVGDARNDGDRPGSYVKTHPDKTTGWRSTCECGADTRPCTVLDPFMGSGTTAQVAQNLNRQWVGIELNKEYCDIAVKRIQNRAAQHTLTLEG